VSQSLCPPEPPQVRFQLERGQEALQRQLVHAEGGVGVLEARLADSQSGTGPVPVSAMQSNHFGQHSDPFGAIFIIDSWLPTYRPWSKLCPDAGWHTPCHLPAGISCPTLAGSLNVLFD
jgi:hypothetical protein